MHTRSREIVFRVNNRCGFAASVAALIVVWAGLAAAGLFHTLQSWRLSRRDWFTLYGVGGTAAGIVSHEIQFRASGIKRGVS